ncbi:MAG: hypothetical protein IJZ72_08195 [Oscillospiraceae bacterium]|nr:hypothetical protein [Oscillospiraceae bacterium]
MIYDEITEFDLYDDIEPDESFEDILKKHSTSLNEARDGYESFISWFENMLIRFEINSRKKILVCLDFISYASTHPADDDIISFWCVCISEENYFLFEPEEDERYNLSGYLRLKADIDNYFKRIKTENDTRQKFLNIVKSISFSDKALTNINISRLYHTFCIDGGLDGAAFKDNLDFVNEKICHSKELLQIAPLVYYALFSRCRKKILKTQGYEPNFTNLLRRLEYVIDADNGKNINNFEEHISIYRCACFFHEKCYDKYLCDMGFAEMSNITECTLLTADSFADIVLPLKNETARKNFDVFPMGLNDNPIFADNSIDIDDLSDYIESDKDKMESLKIIPSIRRYISSSPDISQKYIRLIREDRCNECMEIIFEILDNSEIKKKLKQTHTMDILNAVIIEELHSCISSDIQEQLTGLIDTFNK